jgi:reductive dehalogenase
MNFFVTLFIFFISAGFLIFGLGFTVSSILEKEKRASIQGTWITFLVTFLLLLPLLIPEPGKYILSGFYFFVLLGILGAFIFPEGKQPQEPQEPTHRVDEREIMFARGRLIPGSQEYESYYQDHPEHLEQDEISRSKPGLFSPDALYTDPLSSAAAQGSFALTEALKEAIDGPAAQEQVVRSPEEFTQMVKTLTKFYGALDCGITRLKPYHIYSHIGRGSGTYGAPIDLKHQFAIAFTVEMDFEMTGSAPYPPISMESAKQYVEFARVGVPLAAAIRYLGFPARAHIDGNYRVITPLIARDAGLGEIGRMGILMTPHQGPRVRVGVVTTDLPLLIDSYQVDTSTIDFCKICEKCAQNCPSQSIPYGDREISNGALRWKIDPDSCYQYWRTIGTDCGKCMAVCPYSHPDNWVHNIIRWGISRSGAFRWAAYYLDDFFYGKKPPSRKKSVFT